jgi:hypothetical protein
MTDAYRDAFSETDQALGLTSALLNLLYDVAMDSNTLGSSEPEAVQFMAMLEVAREKARLALEMHEVEWKVSNEHRDEAA